MIQQMVDNWRECVEKADAYKQVGQTNISLWRPDDPPWEYATHVRYSGSGTYRLGICTDFRIEAEHPSGLTFHWTLDLEQRGSDGHAWFVFDTAGILRALTLLPAVPRGELRRHLATAVSAAEEKGAEYLKYAQEQFGMAAVLRQLSHGELPEDGPELGETEAVTA